MEVQKRDIKDYICRNDKYFKIPVFQRAYSWTERPIQQFLLDIENAVNTQKTHYFGGIVVVDDAKFKVVIDGQQRLTTTLLYITSIYWVLKNGLVKEKEYTIEKIKNQFLYDQYGEENDKRKIMLRTVTTDKDVFNKIIELGPTGHIESHKANKQ
ncbi:MAG: DUF262 domain-containing protein, partial [Firmicutes bacterium]|nr:DUF262 domain-containing protein [Bacillota bacterium]